jgi:ATP-dependent RNA helicase RhlE
MTPSESLSGPLLAPATPAESVAPVAAVVTINPTEPVAVTFADFGLHPDIGRAITDMGYTVPTPIQAKAIPVVMTGMDVMGAAQTGTGKTAGFALPILHRLMPHATPSPSPARHPVRALMLAPTRELADQIYVNVREYAKHTPLRVACVYGGVDIKPQLAALRAGCEILIATPGRLLDHVEQKSVNLGQASILVLDEADRMLDMGFLPDIQRIINLLPKPRQSLMFSATFSEEIKRLANSFMLKPQLLEVARRNTTNENVTQTVYKVDSNDAKRIAVAQLVRTKQLSQVIVFSNTKLGTARLARQLIKEGLRADAIHGDKSQMERNKTLEDFKQNKIDILVATDVAARGLDIVELPAVINFDLPRTPEDYVHRIGRTGRAGASGVALSLMAPGEERYLADIEKLIKIKFKVENLVTQAAFEPMRDPANTSRTRERSDNNDRSDRSSTRRDRVRSSLPGHSGDDFFFKPYEETAVANTDEGANEADFAKSSSVKRPVRPVPALLGGKRGN